MEIKCGFSRTVMVAASVSLSVFRPVLADQQILYARVISNSPGLTDESESAGKSDDADPPSSSDVRGSDTAKTVAASTSRSVDDFDLINRQGLNGKTDALASAASLPQYRIRDAGNLGVRSTQLCQLWAINASGLAVGEASVVGDTHAAVWSNGSLRDLGTLDGLTSRAFGVNGHGHAAGYARQIVEGQLLEHAVSFSGGYVRDLGTLGGRWSYAYDINNTQLVVGWSLTADSNARGFAFQRPNMYALQTLGGPNSKAYGVNNKGAICGEASRLDYQVRAVIWDNFNAAPRDLGTLGGSYSVAFDINNRGNAAGESGVAVSNAKHPFAYINGTMIDLDPGGTFGSANGINNHNSVVGFVRRGNRNVAFLYRRGELIDLNTLLPPGTGWQLEAATDINNSGQIVGYGIRNGARRGFIMTPITRPSNATAPEWCQTEIEWAKTAAAVASDGECPEQGVCDSAGVRDGWIPGESTPIRRISIHFVVLANDDGSDPAATESDVEDQMLQLNADFEPAKIQFCATTETIHDTAYRHSVRSMWPSLKRAYANAPATQLNVYILDIQDPFVGIGTFPWDPNALGDLGGVVVDDDSFGAGEKALTHEVGHCLGLWHTHHGVFEVPACSACYERWDRTNGDISGDFAADTPPTPRNFTCDQPSMVDVCSGNSWGDTDPENFMGYAPDVCLSEFSLQQLGRMHCWAEQVLKSWRCDVHEPTGGCCAGQRCMMVTERDCVSRGGIYVGDGRQCAGACVAPDPPSDLYVDNLWAQAFDVCWTDMSSNEDAFRIAISLDGVNWNNHGEVARDTTCYRVNGLDPNTPYYVRVRAANEFGFSDPNPVISITTKAGNVPAPPMDLYIDDLWAQAFDICWTDMSTNEDTFRIAISLDGVNWNNHGEVVRDTTCYRVNGLDPNTPYYVRVRAANEFGFSDPNPVISIRTKTGLPNPPANLRLDNLWAQAFDVCWTDMSTNEDVFRIAISLDGVNWNNHGEVARDTTCYRVNGLNPDTPYYVRVRAANEFGFSDPNPVINIRTKTGLPNPPADLRVVNLWAQAFDVCWTDMSTNEDTFRIAISLDGVNWNNHGEVARDTTCHRVNGLDPNTLYYVRVRAANEFGFSDPNPVISITTKTGLPNPPTDLYVDNLWAQALDVCWTDTSSNEDTFRIAISRDGSNWNNHGEVGPNVRCYRVSGLHPNTQYSLKVRASNSFGFSDYSNVVRVRTRQP